MPIADLEAACAALGADLDIRVRWHGENLDRLLDAAHADLVNRVVRLLAGYGWQAAVEVSFNSYGERGTVDLLAWHVSTRTILVIEVKSVIPDVQAMISSLDRKLRLAGVIGRGRGWDPDSVGGLLVVADTSTTRRRVLALAEVFGTAYPDRALAVRAWLRKPAGRMAGLLFLPISHGDSTRQRPVARERVARSRKPLEHRQ